MSNITYTAKKSGNWGTAANWGGKLPTAADDVSITVAGITVTVATGNYACAELYSSGSTLAISSGTLSVGTSLSLGGAFVQTGGVLRISGQGGTMSGSVAQKGGTIIINNTTLSMQSNTTLAGTIAGSGTLQLQNANLNARAVLSVGEITTNYGTITINTNLTYAGRFLADNGSIALSGHNLTLTGNATLGDTISGTGTIAAEGTGYLGGLDLEGAAILNVSGAYGVNTNAAIGEQSGTTAKLNITAKGDVTLKNNSGFNSSGSGLLSNAGTLVKSMSGQTTYIDCDLNNTGLLQIADGTLALNGPNNTLGGTIAGAGTLTLDNGSTNFAAGLDLATPDLALAYGTASITGTLTYGGELLATGGTLNVVSPSSLLTITGGALLEGANLTGSGHLAIAAPATLNGATLDGSIDVTIAASADQTGSINLNDTATLTILKGASYTLEDSIYGSSVLSVAGTLTAENPDQNATQINASVIDLGLIAISQATLTFQSSITGTGTIGLQAGGHAVFGYDSSIDQPTKIDFLAANASVEVQGGASFAATIADFASGDFIAASFIQASTAKFSVSGETVKLFDSNGDTLSLHFATAQTASSFSIGQAPDGAAALFHT